MFACRVATHFLILIIGRNAKQQKHTGYFFK